MHFICTADCCAVGYCSGIDWNFAHSKFRHLAVVDDMWVEMNPFSGNIQICIDNAVSGCRLFAERCRINVQFVVHL